MSDRYTIKEKIGRGGLGAVYKAHDEQLGREVALKRMLNPDESEAADSDSGDASEALLNEAKVLSALQHPNIVTVYDIGTDAEGGFVVMELLDGETLDETISRGVLTFEDFSEVVRQTLEAMIAAQDVDLVHRDLKPTNVMVIWLPSEKFQLKILDFGLAKFSQKPSVQTSDQGDAILGSIYFMAPEQFERVELDSRTDMYSLGCIYYYTLTGKYPFKGDTAAQVMAAHLQGKMTPMEKYRPDVPEWAIEWVEWLLQRDMGYRPASAKEALEMFNRQTNGLAERREQEAEAARAQVQSRIITGTVQAAEPPMLQVTAADIDEDSEGVQVVQAPAFAAAPPPGYLAATGGHATGAQRVSSGTGSVETPGGVSKKTWILIGISAATILGLGGAALINRGIQSNKQRWLNSVIEKEEPIGDAQTVRKLADYLDPKHDNLIRDGVSMALSKMEGEGVDEAIFKLLDKFKGKEQEVVVKILTLRKYEPAVDKLLALAATSPNADVRKHALAGVRLMGGPERLPALFEILETTPDEKVRDGLERAIVTMARTAEDDGKRTAAVIDRLNRDPVPELRHSLLRVLGYLGGEDALAFFADAVEEKQKEYIYDVLSALMNWPDATIAPVLQKLGETTEDVAIKAAAARAYARILKIPAPRPAEETQAMLDALWGMADSPRDKVLVFDILASYPQDWAVEYAGKHLDDPQLGKIAQRTQAAISDRIAEVPPLIPGEMLTAETASILSDRGGGDAYYEKKPTHKCIVGWTDPVDWVAWDFIVEEAGTYSVTLTQANAGSAGSGYQVIAGEQALDGTVRDTRDDTKFVDVDLGEITFAEPGIYSLAVKPHGAAKKYIMNLRGVTLSKK